MGKLLERFRGISVDLREKLSRANTLTPSAVIKIFVNLANNKV